MATKSKNRHRECLHIAVDTYRCLCGCFIFRSPTGLEWPKKFETAFVTAVSLQQEPLYFQLVSTLCRPCWRRYYTEFRAAQTEG